MLDESIHEHLKMEKKLSSSKKNTSSKRLRTPEKTAKPAKSAMCRNYTFKVKVERSIADPFTYIDKYVDDYW
jgi:hypothetical protein